MTLARMTWLLAALSVGSVNTVSCASPRDPSVEAEFESLSAAQIDLAEAVDRAAAELDEVEATRQSLVDENRLTFEDRTSLADLANRLSLLDYRVRSATPTTTALPSGQADGPSSTAMPSADARESIEIFFTGFEDSRGMTGGGGTDLTSKWIRGTFFPSATEITTIELSATTPTVCALSSIDRNQQYVTGYFDVLGPGLCSVRARYEGDAVYEGANTTASWTIRKISTKLFVDRVEDSAGQSVRQGVDLTSGPVQFVLVGDPDRFPEVVSDTPTTCVAVKVTQEAFGIKRYRAEVGLIGRGECLITASYPGNATYEPAATTESITVM